MLPPGVDLQDDEVGEVDETMGDATAEFVAAQKSEREGRGWVHEHCVIK